MFKIARVFLLTAITFPLYASTLGELPPDWIKRVPLLLHNDAREFYQKINPLIDHERAHYQAASLKNPYELFMECLIFGKLFGATLPEDTDLCLQESVGSILDSSDQQRSYLLSHLNPLPQKAPSQNPSHANTIQLHTVFHTKFDNVLKELFLDKNLYAYFVKGLMLYELGVMSNNQTQKELGERYITNAADGYVFPALSFLQWKYKDNQRKKHFSILIESKTRYLRKLDLQQDLLTVMKNQIEYGINRDLSIQLSPKKYQVTDDDAIDYVQKLRDSLHTAHGFNRSFYDGVLRHLKKTTGSMRRASAYTTSNFVWRMVTIGGATASTVFSGVSVWYGMTHLPENEDMSNENELRVNTMVRNSFITGMASLLSFSYNCYLTYNSPRLLNLSDIDLSKEIELTALYWAIAHHQNDAHEVIADEIIDLWFKQKGGFGQKCETLSQLSLTR